MASIAGPTAAAYPRAVQYEIQNGFLVERNDDGIQRIIAGAQAARDPDALLALLAFLYPPTPPVHVSEIRIDIDGYLTFDRRGYEDAPVEHCCITSVGGGQEALSPGDAMALGYALIGWAREHAKRERRACEHETTRPGPAIQLRHGSHASEICVACGAWRTHGHDTAKSHASGWRTDDIQVVATRDVDDV